MTYITIKEVLTQNLYVLGSPLTTNNSYVHQLIDSMGKNRESLKELLQDDKKPSYIVPSDRGPISGHLVNTYIFGGQATRSSDDIILQTETDRLYKQQ